LLFRRIEMSEPSNEKAFAAVTHSCSPVTGAPQISVFVCKGTTTVREVFEWYQSHNYGERLEIVLVENEDVKGEHYPQLLSSVLESAEEAE
jgi:hypothetical protein